MKRLRVLLIALLLSACGPVVPPPSPPANSPAPEASGPVGTPVPVASVPPLTCQPTDQDQYVYHPARLQVLDACLRVTGTVVRVLREADGDEHIRVEPDPQFVNLLRPSNINQPGCTNGCLVIEPVCEYPVTQADAVATCSADQDPLQGLPQVGQHVWLEGRYVLDLQHGGWAELHPLYRWGVQP